MSSLFRGSCKKFHDVQTGDPVGHTCERLPVPDDIGPARASGPVQRKENPVQAPDLPIRSRSDAAPAYYRRELAENPVSRDDIRMMGEERTRFQRPGYADNPTGPGRQPAAKEHAENPCGCGCNCARCSSGEYRDNPHTEHHRSGHHSHDHSRHDHSRHQRGSHEHGHQHGHQHGHGHGHGGSYKVGGKTFKRLYGGENRCKILEARYLSNPENKGPVPSCPVLERIDGPRLNAIYDRAYDKAEAAQARLHHAENPVPQARIDEVRPQAPAPAQPSASPAKAYGSPPAPQGKETVATGTKTTTLGIAGQNTVWRARNLMLSAAQSSSLSKLPASAGSSLKRMQGERGRKVSLSMIDAVLPELKNLTKVGSPETKPRAMALLGDLTDLRKQWKTRATQANDGQDTKDYGLKDETNINLGR